MHMRIGEFLSNPQLKLKFNISNRENKEIKISKNLIVNELYDLLPDPTATILLSHIPWISEITYIEEGKYVTQKELRYYLRAGEGLVTLSHFEENIGKIFEQYYYY